MSHPLKLAPAEIMPRSAGAEQRGVTLGFVGDVLVLPDTLGRDAENASPLLREALWGTMSGCRMIVANLEAPVTARNVAAEEKPYIHRMPAAALSIFDRRFVLSLANNHVMDFGADGLADTIEALDAAGLPHAGAGLTIEQAGRPCRLELDGTTVAVICAADPRFNPATSSSPGTFPAHRELLVHSIRTEKRRSDRVVVSLHMGLEHVSAPSPRQLSLAQACLREGASVVHFHHSHCLSGAATDGRGIALFGTGNYVNANGRGFVGPYSRRTAAWRVNFEGPNAGAPTLAVEPALLDDTGIPRALRGRRAARELQRIQACSRRIVSEPWRQWTRLRDMLDPGFLRINAYNYGFLLRRRGPRFVIDTLIGGLRTQFGRRTD